jgi:hypothetical protein
VGKVPSWWPDWVHETIVIVASGPSASEVPLSRVEGRARVIAVNTSVKLVPFADMLYACDFSWWFHHEEMWREFQGLRVTIDRRAPKQWPGWIESLECRRPDCRMLLDTPGVIGWGGNSGFGALNLAVQLKPSRVLLVGYDLNIDRGTHWHGDHPGAMTNPRAKNIAAWRHHLDGAARVASAAGVQVLNCSQHSSLLKYPKVALEDVI